MTSTTTAAEQPAWLDADDCRLDDLITVLSEPTRPEDHPRAERIELGVPVYDSAALLAESSTAAGRRAVQAELVTALQLGPGIAVFRSAFADHAVVDRATEAFNALIAEQRASGTVTGDHFAKPGANDRVWNALEKLAVSAPRVFAEYYATGILDLVSVAWLGPGYQVTSQVNVVNPGGEAQTAHRDYHLGFMSGAQAAQYPAHVHLMSPALTLQGAVAHVDMPVESGPTLYLPHSQKYPAGYLAFHRPEFRAYFDDHHVQLPLAKGDAVFFNPALFHGAGANRSADVARMANLLQISSGFGRAMESVDRARVSSAVFPALLQMRRDGYDDRSVANVVAAAAEGYAFPSNLDADQPVDGMAPPTQADVLRRAVDEGWEAGALGAALAEHTGRHRS